MPVVIGPLWLFGGSTGPAGIGVGGTWIWFVDATSNLGDVLIERTCRSDGDDPAAALKGKPGVDIGGYCKDVGVCATKVSDTFAPLLLLTVKLEAFVFVTGCAESCHV